MTERSIPDFHDALLCEAIITLRKMSEGARVQAQALEAQANMVEQLVDASRRYRGHPMQPVEIPGDPAAMTYPTPVVTDGPRRFRHGDIETGREAVNRVRRAMGTSPIVPGEMPEALRDAPMHRTREGREVGPLSPLDEPAQTKSVADWAAEGRLRYGTHEGYEVTVERTGFEDVPAQALEAQVIAEVVPEIEIVEKVIEPVAADTTLDASGKLIPAEPEKPLVDVASVLRQQEEEIQRGQYAVQSAHVPDHEFANLPPEAFPAQAEPVSTIEPPLQPEPAPAPEPTPKPKAPKKASPPVADVVISARDKALNRYADTGDVYTKLAEDLGMLPGTVASYLSVARSEGDKRVAKGDLIRNENETAQEEALREEFRKEATTKRDLVFFDDDLLGSPAYRVNYGLKQIETPHGDLPFNPAWLRVFDILKDRHEHFSADVWQAGRFANERQLLAKLKAVNEDLAKVKLYIVVDAPHYQICGLL